MIRPNKIGLAFILLAITMLAAAINYGNNIIFFISFLFVSLLINSAWQTWRSLAAAQVSIHPIPPHFAGDTTHTTLRVQASLPNPAVTLVLDEVEIQPLGWATGESEHQISLPPYPRGAHPAPRWQLTSRFPLGLWTATRTLPAELALHWVYPRRIGSHAYSFVATPGDTSDAPLAAVGEEEFDHLRPYHPGDPLSRIAFKSYARTGQLVSQQWAGQAQMNPGLPLLDFASIPGNTEQRLSQLSAWIDERAEGNRPFILRLPGQPDRVGHDSAHRLACWQALARFEPRAS